MSQKKGPRLLNDIFKNEDALHSYARAAKAQQQHIEEDGAKPIRLNLPPALKQHTKALQDGHVLILVAANNTVAQVLRFHAPRLAQQAGLNEWFVKVARVEVQSQAQKKVPGHQASLSKSSADVLRATAAEIDHKGLQQALLRLASRAQ